MKIQEALGIPDNFTQCAREVKKAVVASIGDLKTTHSNFKTNIKDLDMRIVSDSKKIIINEINLLVSIKDKKIPSNNPPCKITGTSVTGKDVFVDGRSVSTASPNILDLTFQVTLDSSRCSQQDLQNCFKNHPLIEFTHELKHKFDLVARSSMLAKNMAQYQSLTNSLKNRDDLTSFRPFFEFLIRSYFSNNIEMSVRAVEIKVQMEEENVTKANFYKFLFDTKSFQFIRSCRDYSFRQFIGSIKSNLDDVQQILSNRSLNNLNEQEQIKELLKLFHRHLINALEESMVRLLSVEEHRYSIPSAEFSKNENKIDFFEKFKKEANKFVGREEEFFKKACKQISEQGLKAFKKIAKLYALAESLDEDCQGYGFTVTEEEEDFQLTFAEYFRRSFE